MSTAAITERLRPLSPAPCRHDSRVERRHHLVDADLQLGVEHLLVERHSGHRRTSTRRIHLNQRTGRSCHGR